MVARDIWRYIGEYCAPYAPVEMDGLAGGGESISVQAGRGNPMGRCYLDGTLTGSFLFEIRAKSRDRGRANTWLQQVVDHFKQNPEIGLGDGIQFSAKPLVSPYLLERGMGGGYIYTASFAVEYDERVIN